MNARMPTMTPAMRFSRRRSSLAGIVALCLASLPAPALAAEATPAPALSPTALPPADLPPAPVDASLAQSVMIDGKRLAYMAKIGTLPVRDEHGATIAEVTYTAYTAHEGDLQRPVTFVFNGGPGAAAVFLNLGAIGPRRVQFGKAGNAASDFAQTGENPATWLDFTDLVFIDPVGTGFSRSLLDADRTRTAFFAKDADVHYLARSVADWLTAHGRLLSPTYLMGESYGTYRVPRLAHELETRTGIGIKGLILVSPTYTDDRPDDSGVNPVPWMINLATMAATRMEHAGTLSPAAMAPVETWLRSDFVRDFLAGESDPQALDRLSGKIAAWTGLPADLVRRLGGRIDTATYLREALRDRQQVISQYDLDVATFDPYPRAAQPSNADPILDAIMAPTTRAIVDFATREMHWKPAAPYQALNYAANQSWDRDHESATAIMELRQVLAADQGMKVLIAHGWFDLSSPYFDSKLVLDQFPRGLAARVALRLYPGGHMFYSRPANGPAFHRDALEIYRP